MGFNGRTTGEEIVAGLDLSGRTIVVTGTTAGLGREAARILAGAGAEVVMVARDGARNEAAAVEIRAGNPAARLHTVAMDLGDMASVRRSAAAILAAHPRIHALINNAGMMGGPHQFSPDGLELHFAVNHIGPFLFTGLLWPALKAAAPSRVVVLSSAGHRMGGFDLDDPNFRSRPYTYHEAYCQSKRANVLHAVGLAKRLTGTGVTAYAVHPGAIRTEVFRHLSAADAQGAIDWSAASGSPEKTHSQGAATEIWAAVHPDLAGVSGVYLEDCQFARHIPTGELAAAGVAPEALDEATAERLWALSEEIVGQRFSFA